MPYAMTTFYDGAPPMITAAQLNKLGAGVARAQSTADDATTDANSADTNVTDAVTASGSRTRVIRTSDGDVVTGTTLIADDTLSIIFGGVASSIFRVEFGLLYNADQNCLGTVSFSASNGHAPGSGGADAYWASYARTATALHQSAVLAYYADTVSTGLRSGLPGNLGAVTRSPHYLHGVAHVRNGSSTDSLTIAISTAESIGADRAVTGSGMQLLTGSVMTVQQLT